MGVGRAPYGCATSAMRGREYRLSSFLPMGAIVAVMLALAASTGLADAGLETALLREADGLHPEALHAAVASWERLSAQGDAPRSVLSVIDYALPSTTRRLWVFDLVSRRVLFHELVAHGRNTGDDRAAFFSNEEGSLMSSLGAFVTGASYVGRNGYSVVLCGTEPRVNDNAEARGIVLHGAPYVSDEVARALGRLGRSFGCPAVRLEVARALIDAIKDGSVLYAWFPATGASAASGASGAGFSGSSR